MDYFKSRAQHAAQRAAEAADIVTAVSSAHDTLALNHRKTFLARAFGIQLDGSPLPDDDSYFPAEKRKTYRSVKTVQQHKEMVDILSGWGDDAFLKNATNECAIAMEIKRFRRRFPKGYVYAKDYYVEDRELLDRSVKKVLMHKKDNSIVSDMLHVFDIIDEAHTQGGHMGHDRTLKALTPRYYSPTQDLVRIYCELCYVCREKTPVIPKRKGAKKPIISSHFRDRFQVDLIDMRAQRRKDAYGVWMRWIMTVKDHSTGLIYLASLPRKFARYVAHELEKLGIHTSFTPITARSSLLRSLLIC